MRAQQWRPITVSLQRNTHYEISDDGQVRNVKTNRVLKTHFNHNGYLIVKIYAHGISYSFSVHALVWDAFSEQSRAGKVIDHINEDKSDNRLENLQLLTNRENVSKSIKSKGRLLPTGVFFSKQMAKYVAQIKINNISKHLGFFNCPTAAMLAYQKAKAGII
jgi:hypothetical protein